MSDVCDEIPGIRHAEEYDEWETGAECDNGFMNRIMKIRQIMSLCKGINSDNNNQHKLQWYDPQL